MVSISQWRMAVEWLKYAKVLWQEGLLLAPPLWLFSSQFDSASHQKALASNPFYWERFAGHRFSGSSYKIFTVAGAEGHFENGQGFEWDESESRALLCPCPSDPSLREWIRISRYFIKKPKGGRLIKSDDEAGFRLSSSGPVADQVTSAVPTSIDIGEPNLSLSTGGRPSIAPKVCS